jgi:hypothetical protein
MIRSIIQTQLNDDILNLQRLFKNLIKSVNLIIVSSLVIKSTNYETGENTG